MKITDDMLTEWFPDFVDPTIEGVYEVENVVGTSTRYFSHWNGIGWSWNMGTPDEAHRVASDTWRQSHRGWRGLKEKHHG
ncbi:hypothetical protein [Burkholderia vietnamiensis]|uniref:hypothetical protein n=1 Tax=Burkholderia vietnamiensis TaxID=60552 RepID=UPI00352F4B5D